MENKKELNSRDWNFYQFLKATNGFDTQRDMLRDYEDYVMEQSLNKFGGFNHEFLNKYRFGYYNESFEDIEWNNMSSAREMRKTIKKLQDSDIIQKVIVGDKIAETVEEGKAYLDKKLNYALRILKGYHKQKAKLEKHFQTRIVFNQERDIILAVKESE